MCCRACCNATRAATRAASQISLSRFSAYSCLAALRITATMAVLWLDWTVRGPLEGCTPCSQATRTTPPVLLCNAMFIARYALPPYAYRTALYLLLPDTCCTASNSQLASLSLLNISFPPATRTLPYRLPAMLTPRATCTVHLQFIRRTFSRTPPTGISTPHRVLYGRTSARRHSTTYYVAYYAPRTRSSWRRTLPARARCKYQLVALLSFRLRSHARAGWHLASYFWDMAAACTYETSSILVTLI